jgi:hypothetical protein
MDETIFGPGAAAIVEEARRALKGAVEPAPGEGPPGTIRLRTVGYPRSAGRLEGFVRGSDAQELATEINFNEPEMHSGRVAARRLVEATAAMVLERQAMFGPIYHYPRTFIVGPGAFKCQAAARDAMWMATPNGIKDDGGKVHVRDVDQLVWIKHCAESRLELPGSQWRSSTPVVEVVLLRLNHDGTTVSASDGKARPGDVRALTFREYAGTRDRGFPEINDEYVVEDLAEIGPVLFSDFDNYNLAPDSDRVDNLEAADTAADFGRRAASFLERHATVRVLERRGRHTISGTGESARHASARNTVFWATLAGYLLPAHPAEDPDGRPAAPVGAITPERLVQVALAELPAPAAHMGGMADFALSDDELF